MLFRYQKDSASETGSGSTRHHRAAKPPRRPLLGTSRGRTKDRCIAPHCRRQRGTADENGSRSVSSTATRRLLASCAAAAGPCLLFQASTSSKVVSAILIRTEDEDAPASFGANADFVEPPASSKTLGRGESQTPAEAAQHTAHRRRREREILEKLFVKRSEKNQTHTFVISDQLFGGPNKACWEDPRFTFRKCCNAMHYTVQMNHCWDGNEYTAEKCCGTQLYYPDNCLDFVRYFEFSMVQFLESDPITEALTSCLHFLRHGASEPDEFRGYVRPGYEPFDVAGWHYPTATIQHPNLKKFSFPALDAYVGNQFLVDGTWMPVEVELLRAFLPEGSTVVDAGANIGGFTLPFAKRVGRRGMVYAFEPFRVLFQHLTANVALNGLLNVVTFQHGLGEKFQTVKLPMPNLNVLSNPAKSSVAETDNKMLIETEADFEEEIEIRPLDDYFRKFANKVYMVKIDVEKMEVPMLQGMKAILQYHRPLIFVEDSEEERLGPPLNVTSRPHVLDMLDRMRDNFTPEVAVSSAVTRLLWYYGYLCIDLFKEVGGQLTSLFCAPDEKMDGVWLGIQQFFERTKYRGKR